MNHRMGSRIFIDIPIVAQAVDRGPIAARLVNLSLSGAGILCESCEVLELYSTVHLTMQLPTADKPERIQIEAFVVRKQDQMIGVMFMREMVHLVRRLREECGRKAHADPNGPVIPTAMP